MYLSKLLTDRCASPRSEATRDLINYDPAVVSEMLIHLTEDFDLIERQLTNVPSTKEESQEAIDLRIAIEHALLLAARLLPIVATIVADMYMTDVWEASASSLSPSSTTACHSEISALNKRWRALQSDLATENTSELQTIIGVTRTLATVIETLTRALEEMLLGTAPAATRKDGFLQGD